MCAPLAQASRLGITSSLTAPLLLEFGRVLVSILLLETSLSGAIGFAVTEFLATGSEVPLLLVIAAI
jgi:hypothetical protein